MKGSAKQLAVLAAGLALISLAAGLELGLKPGWQASLVHGISLAILLAALCAFVKARLWAPVITWLVTVAVYDAAMLVRPPMPGFLIWMYTALAFMAALLYLSVNERQLAELGSSFRELADSASLKPYRVALLVLLPAWTAAVVLAKTGSELPAPVFPRSVHPAPPDQSDFRGKGYALAALENPYRGIERGLGRGLEGEAPEKFAAAVAEGKAVYYKNCFFCHGDHLDGRGPGAPAMSPRPANFQDPGTIAMLQESFVFWRVSKGGPGLPASAHPWSSAMPQWEKMLSEDEIWKVVLWLYSYTDQSPRTWKDENGEDEKKKDEKKEKKDEERGK